MRQIRVLPGEFASFGFSTGYAVTDSSVGIALLDDAGALVWISWDEGEAAAVHRCNPDIPLYAFDGSLLRAAGPRDIPSPAPDPATQIVPALAVIASDPATTDAQKLTAMIQVLAQSAPTA